MQRFFLLAGILASLTGFAQDSTGIDTELACETCHVGSDWKSNAGYKFDHNSTGFQLEGTHSDLACSLCHTGSTTLEKHNFGQASGACNACHNDVHEDQWGQDCQRCHSPDTWTLSTRQQNHDLTRFPLQGPHRNIDCQRCHINNPGNGINLPVDCWGCHQNSFAMTTAPSHEILELEKDCESCHSAQASQWVKSFFKHLDTGYALLGMHAEASCSTCHNGPAKSTNTACESCHISNYNSSVNPAHVEEGYPTDCNECHDSFTWNSNFTHDQTGFTLNGAHREVSCKDCHAEQVFEDTPEVCSGCHLSAWQATELPPHSAAEFGQSCETCHSENGWTPSTWSHDTNTAYPLEGRHTGLNCESCHQIEPYSEQPSNCYACHQMNYEATLSPNHISIGIPPSCEVCHSPFGWENEALNHNLTQFPLEGAHAELLCETCHLDGYDLPLTCDGCHLTDFTETSNGLGPDHQQYGFSQDCLQCHNQSEWRPSHFDHDPNMTGYALEGAHLDLLPSDCFACHEDAQWSGISVNCEDCHQSNFSNTTDPDHEANGFPENLCESCHTPVSWVPSIFEHTTTSETCATCHLVQYTQATNPIHDDAGFNTDCQSCHTSDAWQNSTWEHGTETNFTILGAHNELSCNDCHTSTPYSDLVNECSTCHQDNFDQTSDPDHTQAGYPILLCESCHSQTAWQPAIFSHEGNTTTCATCHMTQYNATVNPPHVSLAYSTDCAFCHTTSSWSPSTFSHDIEVTGFLLDGAHLELTCNTCHENYDPPAQVRSCSSASCHQDNYQATAEPPHAAAGFSENCTDCHTTTAWSPSSFSHSLEATGFTIDGAHIEVTCSSCHATWDPPSVVRTCSASTCHLPTYEATTDPNHSAASFPLDCTQCHTTSAWEPSTFNHDGQYFPIYSGEHRGKWNDCSQCHINASNFADFTCFGAGCHNVTTMNNEHCEGSSCESCNGITYPQSGVTPDECLTCHPTGSENDCGGDLLNFFKLRFMPKPSERGPDATR